MASRAPSLFCPVYLLIISVGCAYVGAPQPPALKIPATVSDLSVIERGANIEATFTIPALTAEGMVLNSLGPVELRAGPVTSLPLNMAEWAAQAALIENVPPRPGPAKAEIPANHWINQEIAVAVRLSNAKGRLSDWSNVAKIRLVPPLVVPPGFHVEQVREGVRLSWQGLPGTGVQYRIYRSENTEGEKILATVSENEWLDKSTQFGTKYVYRIQAFEKSADINAESLSSTALEITPAPKFPPAAPIGLRAVAGTESIELEWEPNTEPDLRGYVVYRSANGGNWEKTGEPNLPNYSDHAVKSGQQYRYAVSAIDQAGNESARSAPVEVTL